MTSSETVSLCAQNNALWCDTVLKASGAKTSFQHGYWIAEGNLLPLYPNLVTLQSKPDADLKTILHSLPVNAAIKDSFDSLDIAHHGFRKLFTGTWLFRPAQSDRKPPAASDWQKAVTLDGLQRWLDAWNDNTSLHSVLSPKLLKDPFVEFASITNADEATIKAGCIFNHGPAINGKKLVGLSNVFHRKKWLYGGLHALLHPFPHLPVCTYETDNELLPVYSQLDFEDCGKLAVWLKVET